MIDTNKLIGLFTRYGYRIVVVKENMYAIFSCETSMYPAVEIIRLSKKFDEEIQKQKKEYSESGYAVRVCEETSIEQIELYLFNWFFQVKDTNNRISVRYKEYIESIMQAYANKETSEENCVYKYINIPFSLEENFNKQVFHQDGILDSIKGYLKKSGPQLIIVEAGAGFGKTSTVFEVLKDYSSIEKDIRPFFMELSKDRIAPTFHYLLNSQIDANFNVRLGSDIVLYNIKRGYIPLIIDGFDELLSKDMDNGDLELNFNDVQTMLSTIADLLIDEAKVILTTRKTAIFSGENFYSWYTDKTKKTNKFGVIRYQLGIPSIDDWLPKRRQQGLPSNFEKISNPVLLSYLRYLNEKEFNKAVNSSSLTEHYLTSILEREMDRQNLPFNTNEQTIILRRLAAYFAGLDITACSRQEIQEGIEETSLKLLEERASIKRDVKSLLGTLTNHAFLDRKGDKNIGFLNDFVFGTFFMYSIIEEEPFFDVFFKEAPFSMLEKAIFAASSSHVKLRCSFWDKLQKKCKLNKQLMFLADTLLKDKTMREYCNVSFDGYNLHGVFLGSEDSKIEGCSFSNMTFSECLFDFNYINNCAFVNCSFKFNKKEGNSRSCGFYGCRDIDMGDFVDKYDVVQDVIDNKSDTELLLDLLKLYFHVDGYSPRMRKISRIKDSFEQDVFKRIFSIAEAKNYIYYNGDRSFITKEGRTYYNENKK